jgi:predicted Zn-dependent protease
MKHLVKLLIAASLLVFNAACSPDEPITDDNPIEIPEVNERAFLTADDFGALTVELLVMEGMMPTNEALDDLKTFLSNRLNKPDGVELVITNISAKGKARYSVADISEIIENEKKIETQIGELAAHIVFADGEYEQSGVLGVAYGKNSMAIFEEYIQENTGGLGEPSVELIESTVLQHEFGHTLGLVGVGTPNVSNHEDGEHEAHCNNEDCLMYWSVETGDIFGNLLGGSVPELDGNCIADLRANGGK